MRPFHQLKEPVVLAALFICFTFLTSAPYAQAGDKFIPGYYINNNGDTVTGSIEFKDWNYSPVAVGFKSVNGTETLTPANSKGFFANGETYVSYTGRRLVNPVSLSGLVTNAEDSTSRYDTVKVFLRQIATTDKGDLLMLSDLVRSNFYLKLPGTPAVELVYKTYLSGGNMVEDKTYRNQIQAAFAREIVAGKLAYDLERLQYKERHLTNFFSKLTNKPEAMEKKVAKYRSEFSVIAGASHQSFKFAGNVNTSVLDIRYNSSLAPIAGIAYKFYRQRNFGRYFGNAQLKFSSFVIEGSSSKYESSMRSGLFINLDVMPGFNILNYERMNWSVSVGPSVYFLTNNRELRKSLNSQEVTEFDHKSPMLFTITLQTGLTINKKFVIWTQYYLPTETTNYLYFTGKYSSVQAGVGYIL